MNSSILFAGSADNSNDNALREIKTTTIYSKDLDRQIMEAALEIVNYIAIRREGTNAYRFLMQELKERDKEAFLQAFNRLDTEIRDDYNSKTKRNIMWADEFKRTAWKARIAAIFFVGLAVRDNFTHFAVGYGISLATIELIAQFFNRMNRRERTALANKLEWMRDFDFGMECVGVLCTESNELEPKVFALIDYIANSKEIPEKYKKELRARSIKRLVARQIRQEMERKAKYSISLDRREILLEQAKAIGDISETMPFFLPLKEYLFTELALITIMDADLVKPWSVHNPLYDVKINLSLPNSDGIIFIHIGNGGELYHISDYTIPELLNELKKHGMEVYQNPNDPVATRLKLRHSVFATRDPKKGNISIMRKPIISCDNPHIVVDGINHLLQ